MNWIDNVVRPKIRSFLNKRDVEDNLWVKCPESGEMVFHRDLESNQWVVPNSGYHMKIKAADRLTNFFDEGKYTKLALPSVAHDPLKFRDIKRYADRLKEYRAKTGNEDSVIIAQGDVYGTPMTVGVQDFEFMGGSLGMAAGSAIITGLSGRARQDRVRDVCRPGARMQEGILSLMQMPRTTVAVQRLREARLPYIVVSPTPPPAVTASYAMLGDIHLAEPEPRSALRGHGSSSTIREKLPRASSARISLRSRHGRYGHPPPPEADHRLARADDDRGARQ